MNFIEELQWRGMLHNQTPGAQEELDKNMGVGYIGFDPTAPSLTIGNFVQVMMLLHWQRCGNKPIVLMGGATGRIGDPSGKDAERTLKSFDELDANLEKQVEQFKKFLNFDEGENKAEIINNLDFYKDMDVISFLRNIGKTLTINYMMSKDSVKKRVETGLSFTEFSYQLLQAYDFQYLYKNHDCKFQIGGSDQWGNITSGTEFIRKNLDNAKPFAITTPLLTKSDGKKFGKSEDGNIWMDPKLTSPYKFYQYVINTPDADLSKMLRYFSLKSREEIETLEMELSEDPNQLKRILAKEMTIRVHSEQAHHAVENVSQILYNRKLDQNSLLEMEAATFESIKEEIASFHIPRAKLSSEGIALIDLISEKLEIVSSKSEGRRAIKNQALAVNKVKVAKEDQVVYAKDLIHDKYLFLENGKKNKIIISFD